MVLRSSMLLSAAIRSTKSVLGASKLHAPTSSVYITRRSVLTIKKSSIQPKSPRTKRSTAPKSTQSTDDTVMRLAKRIALSGECSRREAEKLIASHAVQVNGKVVTDLGTQVAMQSDVVSVNNKVIQNTVQRRVWIAHKLKGELVTTNDPDGRPTIFDRLKTMGLVEHMMPVGRLDYNTEGLLLFTNDGEYARELEHPKSGVVRVYRALVRGQVSTSKLEDLKRGPLVEGFKYRPIHANVESQDKKDSWLKLKLSEGKNREVRNVLAHVRLVLKRLVRVQYGPYRLADLPQGAVLEVKAKDMKQESKRKVVDK